MYAFVFCFFLDSTKALQENPKPQDLFVEAPPDVQVFAKKSVRDSRKLILTCLITGFYHKDVKMSLRKSGTSFPEHLITSSGVRPNDDGTYQLRKSVEISDDDPADYYCFVSHSSLTEPVIKQWDGRCIDCPNSLGAIIGGSVSGVVVVLCPVIVFVVMITTLIDSGAEGNFMNHQLARQLQIPIEPLENPVKLSAVDGKPIGQGTISHTTVPVRMNISALHSEEIRT
ncbi:class II histocompatibility antigen, B-L beta chain [Astyanax mexicanus]|uniref:class II histocompatibility antigen, B-L beta chain n=1 Tax=Astyanax mexicanus TaxID=7994 RepID=UPI0020CB04CD|nr:class II histocompatibility antigen, B-L beta chain [Astyanax mexicanus]